MKKWFCFILFVLIVLSSVVSYHWYQTIRFEENYEDIWKTHRKLPSNLALNAYLAGNYAKKSHHIPLALDAYEKVLKADPDQTRLLKEFYVLAMFQGKPQMLLPYLDKEAIRDSLFSDYLKAAQLFKDDPYLLLQYLQKKPHQQADTVIIPLIQTWYFAKENNKESATASLKLLKDNRLNYIQGYHEFLLGQYFNDEELQNKGWQKIQDKKLPAISFFPLLKKYAQKNQIWEKTQFYKQFQKMEKLYPATADLIQQFGQSKITPETGLAESFYFLSAEGAMGLFSKEELIILNSIALFLQPDKNLSLIWGAELNQAFDLPHISLDYYNRIPSKSATLLFKEAAVLLLADRYQEAEQIMEDLQKTNPNHIPLLTLMGQNYVATKQNQKALKIYDHLIPLLEQNPQNKPLAEAYATRANLYQKNDQAEKMLSDFQRAQILMPDDAILQNNIGYNYLEMDRIDEGFELIQKAYHNRPQDPYILDSLAFAYYKKNHPQTALPFAEKAINLLPKSSLINMHLGDIYQAIGRTREAGFQYKKALDLKDDLTPEMEEQLHKKIEQLSAL